MASPEDSGRFRDHHGSMRIVLAVMVLLVSACSSARGFVETTTTNAPDADQELDATFEFPVVGYEIDHPSAWSTDSSGSLSFIAVNADDIDAGIEAAINGPVIMFEYFPLADMVRFGVGADPTPGDLAELNISHFDLTEPNEIADVVVAAAPAATFRTTDMYGNHLVTIQGSMNEYAYRLFMHAADEGQLYAYLETWNAMVDSIRPTS